MTTNQMKIDGLNTRDKTTNLTFTIVSQESAHNWISDQVPVLAHMVSSKVRLYTYAYACPRCQYHSLACVVLHQIYMYIYIACSVTRGKYDY